MATGYRQAGQGYRSTIPYQGASSVERRVTSELVEAVAAAASVERQVTSELVEAVATGATIERQVTAVLVEAVFLEDAAWSIGVGGPGWTWEEES